MLQVTGSYSDKIYLLLYSYFYFFCRGRCSSQGEVTLLLPDITYLVLKLCLDFLYLGRLECSLEERGEVRQVLVGVLGVRRPLVEEVGQDQLLTCTSCPLLLVRQEAKEHLVSCHVLEPAQRDLELVAGGDNGKVASSALAPSKPTTPGCLLLQQLPVHHGPRPHQDQ